MSLEPFFITGYSAGLMTNKKPFLLPDRAWSQLNNAYTWRDRVKKREGLKFLGRLRRAFNDVNVGFNPGGTATGNILTVSGYPINITNAVNAVVTTFVAHHLSNGDIVIFSDVNGMTQINGLAGIVTVLTSTTFSVNIDSTLFGVYTSGGFFFSNHSLVAFEPNAELEPGSIVYTIHDGPDIVFTDQGDGTLTSPTAGNSGHVNYVTGDLTITTTAAPATLASASFAYFPSLPVMGIPQREIAAINDEQTIWFDEVYAYVWNGSSFNEFIPGTTWNSSDSDFF